MGFAKWVRERHIYLIVVILLLAIVYVMWLFYIGQMNVEAGKLYTQALTGIATLALLYYAYFNVASKKEEDIARLELAVRPILIWELESEKGGALFTYKTLKHPIYDFSATLSLGSNRLKIEERHLDVSEGSESNKYKRNVSAFISGNMGRDRSRLLSVAISYHSEVGGKYDFLFTKEVVHKRGDGFSFQHRKIISAKYPWQGEKTVFSD